MPPPVTEFIRRIDALLREEHREVLLCGIVYADDPRQTLG
jgi:hypothetical protein